MFFKNIEKWSKKTMWGVTLICYILYFCIVVLAPTITVMVKYDMCRLIITVEDSGCGMNIGKINDILTLDKPF